MNYNLCSITFRHELVSFPDLVRFASRAGFDGIELWGVHAQALESAEQFELPELLLDMKRHRVSVSMISDYLNVHVDEAQFQRVVGRLEHLAGLAHSFGTRLIRIFAGNAGSAAVSPAVWRTCVRRLRELADRAECLGCQLVVETHPDTLADTLESTLRLLDELAHPCIRINLDFLHLWETGTAPEESYAALQPWIANLHLKNIASKRHLTVFAAERIYSPNASREGIVPLAEGAIDYSALLRHVLQQPASGSASIEWFGGKPYQTLVQELAWLRGLEEQEAAAQPVLPAAAWNRGR